MSRNNKQFALLKLIIELKHYFLLTLSIIFSIFATIRDLAVAITMAYGVDAIIQGKEVTMALVYVGIAALSGTIIRSLQVYFCNRYLYSCQRYILKRMAEKILALPVKEYDESQSGDILSKYTTETERILHWISYVFPGGISLIAYAVGMFIYGLTQSVSLTIIVFPVIIALAPLLSKLSKSLSGFIREERESVAKSMISIQEILLNPELIKTYAIEETMRKRVTKDLKRRADVEKKAAFSTAVIHGISIFGSFIPGFITAAVGIFYLANGWITAGFLVSFVQIAIKRIGNILNHTAQFVVATRRAEASAERIINILEKPNERADGNGAISCDEDIVVSFDDVSFSYANKDNTLSNISFEIKKGETIALVGQSGCGKSTILKLLMGFYETDSGNIKIYGQKISDWNLEALRDLIAIVFQDLFVFPASIRMNLSSVKETMTEDELTHAISFTELSSFIEQLPEGIDTILGEKGDNISGGQRQRITIARAFLKNAPILLLDEPTSALDSVTEAGLQRSIEKLSKGKTTIVVAHRLKTIQKADRIIVLDNGRLVQIGTHKELIASDNIYRHLYQQQLHDEKGDYVSA